MTIFTIDPDNNITAFDSAPEAKRNPHAEQFSSAKGLGRLAQNWPGSRLLEIWNTLPRQRAVKRFTSRKAAATRIWRAIQSLAPQSAPPTPAVVRKYAKPGKRLSRGGARGITRPDTKTKKVVELLHAANGVTLKELMAATKWQAHSVRGFISGTLKKKMGLAVQSAQTTDGERSYSIKP